MVISSPQGHVEYSSFLYLNLNLIFSIYEPITSLRYVGFTGICFEHVRNVTRPKTAPCRA